MDIGIRALTVFAFSSENWQRPANEVALLMKLLEQTVHDQLPRMLRHQISLRFIGDRGTLTPHLRAIMQDAEEQTAHFTKMSLVIAISYGIVGITAGITHRYTALFGFMTCQLLHIFTGFFRQCG